MKKIKGEILQFKELYGIKKSDPYEKYLSTKSEYKTLFDEVKRKHSEYVSSISSPDMAMSLELAFFILSNCLKTKPQSLLDLGSGFSSYIFRLYQKNSTSPVNVYSIDDHDEWLNKTKIYLAEQKLSTEHLFNLDYFLQNSQGLLFDFILLDLNFVEKRKEYIDFSINILKPTGVLIIDDVHKIEFLRQVKEKSKHNSCKLINIKNQTKDSFGRFSILLTK